MMIYLSLMFYFTSKTHFFGERNLPPPFRPLNTWRRLTRRKSRISTLFSNTGSTPNRPGMDLPTEGLMMITVHNACYCLSEGLEGRGILVSTLAHFPYSKCYDHSAEIYRKNRKKSKIEEQTGIKITWHHIHSLQSKYSHFSNFKK